MTVMGKIINNFRDVSSLSIRSKLILSYIAMTILPVIILLSIYFVYSYTLHHQHIYKRQGIEFIESERIKVLGETLYTTQNDPNHLLDKNYQVELNKKMNDINSGMIIQKGQHLIFSSAFLKKLDNIKMLNEIGKHTSAFNDDAQVKVGDYNYYLDVLRFTYSDGSKGAFYFFKYKEPVPIWIQPEAIILSIIILIITSLTLTYLVSRNIINPIRRLEHAAGKIKDGDLNFVLTPGSNDEIGKLNHAFEEMRIRLKESIDKGLMYEKNRKELISNISHDLRTPLTAIKGYVEGLKDGIPRTEAMKSKYLQTIYKKANDMEHLIEELFLLSKLDLKQLPFHFDRIDMKAYVQECVEECRLVLENKNITLQTDLPEHAVYIKGDREKLWRAIMNIIDNSIKYMALESPSDRRWLNVALVEEIEVVKLSIEDTGPGIEQGELPFLFDRFYRPEASRNSQTGGTGLGLSIVKQIVEAHQGQVQIRSVKDKGTVVEIIIPKWVNISKEGDQP